MKQLKLQTQQIATDVHLRNLQLVTFQLVNIIYNIILFITYFKTKTKGLCVIISSLFRDEYFPEEDFLMERMKINC